MAYELTIINSHHLHHKLFRSKATHTFTLILLFSIIAMFFKHRRREKKVENNHENTSEDTTVPNKSPSSSPERYDNSYEGDEGGTMLKTAIQVRDELGGSEEEENGVAGDVVTMAPAGLVVVGDGDVVQSGVIVSEGLMGRKRKGCEVRDPPIRRPSCPLCNREFSTWKGAFGHMRKHPDRAYRGFFKPPVFGSTSSNDVNKGDSAENNATHEGGYGKKGSTSSPAETNTATGEGLMDRAKGSTSSTAEGMDREKGSTSAPIGRIEFDLNQLYGEAALSDRAAAEPAQQFIAEEGNVLGFDLNEMAPAEDDVNE